MNNYNKKKELVFFRKKGLPSAGEKKSELALRARRKACGAGPRRDIVGA